jgi:hypothetical protein
MAGNHVDRKFARGIARLLQFAWQFMDCKRLTTGAANGICPIARHTAELRFKK